MERMFQISLIWLRWDIYIDQFYVMDMSDSSMLEDVPKITVLFAWDVTFLN